MSLLTGQTIDKYYIQRKLGEGGMGAVYQARHLQLDHVVAIAVRTS